MKSITVKAINRIWGVKLCLIALYHERTAYAGAMDTIKYEKTTQKTT